MPGRTRDLVAGDAEMVQRADHGFFHAVDVFLDVVARALQVDERVGDHLPRPVEGDLPAAIGGDHRNLAGSGCDLFACQPYW